jgi:hypothetical protein
MPGHVRTTLKVSLFLVLAAAAWLFFCTGTPLYGPTLKLKDTPIASIELSMFSTNRVISASNDCARVRRILSAARSEGPPATAPPLGYLILYYADGTTNRFYLQPGSRFGGMDIVNEAGSHTVSTSRLFDTLQSVGLITKDRR